MLKMIAALPELRFMELMTVYEESNLFNAAYFYGKKDQNAAVIQVEQDFYQYLSQVFFPVEGAFYAVWEEKGRYISALRMEPYQDGMLLEALETAPEYRRMGYATKLIRSVVSEMEKPVYSHVHKKNIASLNTHKSCGFLEFLDHARYIDGTINWETVTLRFEKGK